MIARLSLLLGAFLLVGFTEPTPPSKPFDPVEATRQGRELVGEILSQKPAQNFTSTGVLNVRPYKGKRTEVPVTFEIHSTTTNWLSLYQTRQAGWEETFCVQHTAGESNAYFYRTNQMAEPVPLLGKMPFLGPLFRSHALPADELTTHFAGSDFWLIDLGLEFLHWPDQKVMKSELRKTRLCRVLESVNPSPTTNSYSRVVSWIDDESRGILRAEAYDAQNKLLKEFDTKTVKPVNGEWQLEQMEIYNVQTRSRTQIKFNFDTK